MIDQKEERSLASPLSQPMRAGREQDAPPNTLPNISRKIVPIVVPIAPLAERVSSGGNSYNFDPFSGFLFHLIDLMMCL